MVCEAQGPRRRQTLTAVVSHPVNDAPQFPPLILAKINEQFVSLDRLIGLVPGDKLDWSPSPGAFQTCELLGHILECLAGFCAVLYAARPDELAHLSQLRDLEVNHRCGIDEARRRISEYATHIREGFSRLRDEDLGRRLPTVFNAEGDAVLTLLLNNLEHLINHKYQLFFYLKLTGVTVGTTDLYSLARGGQE